MKEKAVDISEAYQTLLNNFEWVEPLQKAIKHEEVHDRPDTNPLTKYLGWDKADIGVSYNIIQDMIQNNLVKVMHETKEWGFYKLRARLTIKTALDKINTQEGDIPKEAIPDDLFYNIVGYESTKKIIEKVIRLNKPQHILLHGPPATAKSLFLGELTRLPRSKYVLGSSVSKAGLIDYLLEYDLKFLIVDEIEKAKEENLSVLLSLMEIGTVTRLKHNKRETKHLKTCVFAGTNEMKQLPKELLSRFIPLETKPYNKEELKEVAHGIIHNHKKETIDYIVDQVSQHSKDVRDVQKIANLCNNQEEVNFLVNAIWG